MNKILMNKRNYILILCGLITIAAVYLLGNYANEKDTQIKQSFDFASFNTIQEEVEAADVVVTAEILGKTTRKIDIGEGSEGLAEDILDYDVYSMKVNSVAKGNLEVGAVIEVKQLASVKDFIDYSVGEQGIFFLMDFTMDDLTMPYSLMSPRQGYIGVDLNSDEVTYNYFETMQNKNSKIKIMNGPSSYSEIWDEIIEAV